MKSKNVLSTMAFLFLFWGSVFATDFQAKKSKIVLYVVSTYGHVVDGAEVKLIRQNETFKATWNSGVYEVDVPNGEFQLSVVSRGFALFKRQVEISHPEERIIASLRVGTIDFTSRDMLSGQISGLSWDSAPIWIRLVPVFGYQIKEDLVRKPGSFQFSGVAGGEYLLLVVKGESVIDLRRIRVTDSNRHLSINLPE